MSIGSRAHGNHQENMYDTKTGIILELHAKLHESVIVWLKCHHNEIQTETFLHNIDAMQTGILGNINVNFCA